jgi:hypothetical protein
MSGRTAFGADLAFQTPTWVPALCGHMRRCLARALFSLEQIRESSTSP